jgi:hypothetical protein
VQAVFLNELSYGLPDPDGVRCNTLRFLGYYELTQSCYVMGDDHEDVAAEFSHPTDAEWSFLTFWLHRHLRIEARPFIPTLAEVDKLINDETRVYKTIVIDHDDHGDILFHCVGRPDDTNRDSWYYNHAVTIDDIIEQLIATKEIQKYVSKTLVSGTNKHPARTSASFHDRCMESTELATNVAVPYERNERRHLGTKTEEDSLLSDNDELDVDEEWKPDADDSDEESVYEEFSNDPTLPVYEFPNDSIGQTTTTAPEYQGTGATIADIVRCCVCNSAAMAMRHNQKTLKNVDGKICAAPLSEKSLGITLRTRPTPSSNRALDVNMCYLCHTFQEYDVLLPAMSISSRTVASRIKSDILEDMLFQIILFRYTGRVYRYEQYRHYYNSNYFFGFLVSLSKGPLPVLILRRKHVHLRL